MLEVGKVLGGLLTLGMLFQFDEESFEELGLLFDLLEAEGLP